MKVSGAKTARVGALSWFYIDSIDSPFLFGWFLFSLARMLLLTALVADVNVCECVVNVAAVALAFHSWKGYCYCTATVLVRTDSVVNVGEKCSQCSRSWHS